MNKKYRGWISPFREICVIRNDLPTLKFHLKLSDKYEMQKNDLNGNHIMCSSQQHKETSVDTNLPKIIFKFHCSLSIKDSFPINDFQCLWCSLNCRELDGLMKHLHLCHDRLQYDCFVSDEEIEIHIHSKQIIDYNFRRYVCNKRKNYRFHRFHNHRSIKQMNDYNMNEQLNEENDHFIIYKSSTNLPVKDESDFENDSESDPCPQWLNDNNDRLIDDFTDVNEGEKEMFKLWNKFISKQKIVSAQIMPILCKSFIDECGESIIRKKLYRNCVLHFCNLYDHKVLTADNVFNLICELKKNISNTIT